MRKTMDNEDVLDCAVELIRAETEVSARNLAKRLGCSTQPVYSVFRNMAELERELDAHIGNLHRRYIAEYSGKSGYTLYKAYGMGFVKFAKAEKQLFRRLYIDRPFHKSDLEQDPYYVEVIGSLQSIYGMDKASAVSFHLDMTIYSYGLAAMQSADSDMSDDEISERLTAQFRALYRVYIRDRNGG